MNEPIDELFSYADHTQGCMVGAWHDECTCGYDDAEGKAQAAWEALKADNERLRADAERFIWLADRMARYAALVKVNPSDDDASDKNWFHIEQGEDLRVAIDAARSPQGTPK